MCQKIRCDGYCRKFLGTKQGQSRESSDNPYFKNKDLKVEVIVEVYNKTNICLEATIF